MDNGQDINCLNMLQLPLTNSAVGQEVTTNLLPIWEYLEAQ